MKHLPTTLAAILALTIALSACGKRGKLETPGQDDTSDEARLELTIERSTTS